MQSTIRKALPAALSAALVAGAFAVPAIAVTDDATTDDPVATATEEGDAGDPERGHRMGHRGLRGLDEGDLADRLGTELGIDATTVQEALDAVRQDLAEERLAGAVEDGRLTQAQADEISSAIADGTLQDVLPGIRLDHLEERLAARVEAGDLTREQADEMLADAEEGDWPGRGRGRHGGEWDRPAPDVVEPDTSA